MDKEEEIFKRQKEILQKEKELIIKEINLIKKNETQKNIENVAENNAKDNEGVDKLHGKNNLKNTA